MNKHIIVAALVILGFRLAALARSNPCVADWSAGWENYPQLTVTGTGPNYFPIDTVTFSVSPVGTSGTAELLDSNFCASPQYASPGVSTITTGTSTGIPIGDSSLNPITSVTGTSLTFVPLAAGAANITFTLASSSTATFVTSPGTLTVPWSQTTPTNLIGTAVSVGSIGASNPQVIVWGGTNQITITANPNPTGAPLTEIYWQRNYLPVGSGAQWTGWANLTGTNPTITLTGTDQPGTYVYRSWNGSPGLAISGTAVVAPAVSGTLYSLPPIYVKSSLNNPQNGGLPIQSATSVCVGEPLTLSIPGAGLVTNYSWDVEGAIKSFDWDATNPVSPLMPEDMESDSVTLYLPVVPQNASGGDITTSAPVEVSCDVTLFGGTTFTLNGTLNLVAPSVTVNGTMEGNVGIIPPGVLYPGSPWTLEDGNPVPSIDQPGAAFSASSPQPPSGFGQGSNNWLQVVSNDVLNEVHNGNYVNVPPQIVDDRDLLAPYPPTPNTEGLQTTDSPSSTVTSPPATGTEQDRSFSAEMYFMWKSNAPDSIWVPLRVVPWYWYGEMDWVLNGFVFGATYISPTHYPLHVPVTLSPVAPIDEPKWSGIKGQ